MAAQGDSITAAEIFVATVTYGNRLHFLENMVRSVASQGIRNIFIFSNGLDKNTLNDLKILNEALALQLGVVIVLKIAESNIGSAEAYAVLLEILRNGSHNLQGVLLMDDDNLLEAHCVEHLLSVLLQKPNAAFSAVRSSQSYMVKASLTGRLDRVLPGSAYGVDFRKKFYRLYARLRHRSHDHQVEMLEIPKAPFGGLLVSKYALSMCNVPRKDFVIYAEDYEYTERLSQTVGLYLARHATVHDQEQSWNTLDQSRMSNIHLLATCRADFRMYYGVRNAVYLDCKKSFGVSKILLHINIFCLAIGVAALALRHRNFKNIRTLGEALTDGYSGRLGLNQNYPLP